jgi:hypothetical protein
MSLPETLDLDRPAGLFKFLFEFGLELLGSQNDFKFLLDVADIPDILLQSFRDQLRVEKTRFE